MNCQTCACFLITGIYPLVGMHRVDNKLDRQTGRLAPFKNYVID